MFLLEFGWFNRLMVVRFFNNKFLGLLFVEIMGFIGLSVMEFDYNIFISEIFVIMDFL